MITAIATAAPTLSSPVEVLSGLDARGMVRVRTLGGGVGGWAPAGKELTVGRHLLSDIAGDDDATLNPTLETATTTAAFHKGGRVAVLSGPDHRGDVLVIPFGDELEPWTPRGEITTVGGPAISDVVGPLAAAFPAPEPEPTPVAPAPTAAPETTRRSPARIAAYIAMCTLASRLTDSPRVRAPRGRMGRTPEYWDLVTSMCDQRAALSIAIEGGATARVDRNGYRVR
jgi:hypothetical protein